MCLSQVSVAVLIDNFINETVRVKEEDEENRQIAGRYSFICICEYMCFTIKQCYDIL